MACSVMTGGARRRHSRRSRHSKIRSRGHSRRHGHAYVHGVRIPTTRIRRHGYSRRGYRRKSGVRVRPTHVRSSIIMQHGLHRHPGLLPKPTPGALGRYGYKMHKKQKSRHSSLKKAVKSKGYAKTIRELNEISILMRNSNPRDSRVARSDMKWLKKHRGQYKEK